MEMKHFLNVIGLSNSPFSIKLKQKDSDGWTIEINNVLTLSRRPVFNLQPINIMKVAVPTYECCI